MVEFLEIYYYNIIQYNENINQYIQSIKYVFMARKSNVAIKENNGH